MDTDSESLAFVSARDLVMHVTNMPKKINLGADITLQELTLLQDSASVQGHVRVKNVALEKAIVVRFTFDRWQTTSEVAAKYIASVEDNTFDVFSFTIRLNYIMDRNEEKDLFLALKYTVAGREIWDNNGGQNYLVKFTKLKVLPQKVTTDDSEDEVSSDGAITHLNKKLQHLAQVQNNPRSFPTQPIHQGGTILVMQKLSTLQTEKSLSGRYDLSSSLKNALRTASVSSLSSPRRLRANTHPSSHHDMIPWPQKVSPIGNKKLDFPPRSPHSSALASPGLDDSQFHSRASASPDVTELPFQIPQRAYFGMSDKSMVKGTPQPLARGIGSHSTGSSELTLSMPSLSSSASRAPSGEITPSMTTERHHNHLSRGNPDSYDWYNDDHYSLILDRYVSVIQHRYINGNSLSYPQLLLFHGF